MNQNTGKLLSPQEREACSQIASGGAPHSQYAQALLAVDEGNSQIQAAARSGLTKNQVKYWVGKFRADRLSIFPPAAILAEPETPPSDVETPDEVADTDNPAPLPETEPEKKAKKGKKGKKGKKSKKAEKAKRKSKKKKKSKKA